jgi:hypothetical protein
MGRAVGARKWGGALLGALLVAQPMAAAAPGDRPSRITPDGALGRAEVRSIRTAVLERSLIDLGVPKEALTVIERAQRVQTGRWLLAEPAGDLDGDGTEDVFESDVRYRFTVGGGGADDEVVSIVTARDGATGKKIWRKKFDTDVWPVPWRVGAKGRPGALLIGNVSSLLDPAGGTALSFDARSGPKGKRLWNYSFTSTSTGTPVTWVSADQLVSLGRFDAVPGKAQELMLGVSTIAGTLLTSSAATRTVVIDGRDGTDLTHPILDVGVGWIPLPAAVGDLDRDGFDDVVTTNNPGIDPGGEQETPVVGPMVYARKGSDGSAIWYESVPMTEYAYAWDMSDVAGSRTPEVGLETYLNGKWHAYLLEGDFGTPWWDGPADWMDSPGDIDRDGRRDVVVTRWFTSFAAGRMRFVQRAMRGSGAEIWTRETVWDHDDLPCPRGACARSAGFWADTSSDVDPDGVRDMVMGLYVSQNVALDDSTSRVLDGRTGRLVYESDAELSATGVAMDRRGHDLTSLEVAGNAMTLRGVDGRGKVLWGGPLEGPRRVLPRSTGHFSMGLDLPGDRCGDVLVDVFDDGDTFYAVIDGGSGRILWSRWSGAKAEHPSFARNTDLNPAC